MSIQARKLEFIQEFLEIQNEDVILHLESLMKLEQNRNLSPMSIAELNERIDLSEQDFAHNKFKTNDELLQKYS
jgi:DNA-binding transcriptional regulator YiaG